MGATMGATQGMLISQSCQMHDLRFTFGSRHPTIENGAIRPRF